MLRKENGRVSDAHFNSPNNKKARDTLRMVEHPLHSTGDVEESTWNSQKEKTHLVWGEGNQKSTKQIRHFCVKSDVIIARVMFMASTFLIGFNMIWGSTKIIRIPYHNPISTNQRNMSYTHVDSFLTPSKVTAVRQVPRIYQAELVFNASHQSINDTTSLSRRSNLKHNYDNQINVDSNDENKHKLFIDQSMCVSTGSDEKARRRTNCNVIHELSGDIFPSSTSNGASLIGTGGWRGAWKFDTSHSLNQVKIVLKTIKLQSDLFTEHVYRRHFVDASVTDSLMSLKREIDEPSQVVDIYGYCAHATINEFAEKNLRNFIKSKMKKVRIRKKGQKTRRAKVLHISPMEKLHYASQVAKAVANLHQLITLNDFRMTVHKDLKPDNIVLIQPSTRNKLMLAKMSDFNDAEILLWNTTDDSPCRFRRKRWISEYQSPEEMLERELNEKVDVFALGGLFYYILTGHSPYDGCEAPEVAKRIASGAFPDPKTLILVAEEAKASPNNTLEHPATKALMKAINLAWQYNPENRATASNISSFLDYRIATLNAYGFA